MPTDLFDNAEYVDQPPAADSVHSTPPERSHSGYLSINGKRWVMGVDPHKGRCLVENCIEEKAVDFAHCLARSYRSNSDFLDSLEWAWDLPRDTLNVDTRYNIFRLTATLHRLFDDKSWFLLPESNIVDQYYNALTGPANHKVVVRGKFPVIPNGDFTYKFIPLSSEMNLMAIMRQFTAPIPVTSNATSTVDPQLPVKSDFTVHMFPFDTLPSLVTHLHPRFVICNTAAKMRSPTIATGHMYHDYPILVKIDSIYQAWTQPVAPPCFKNPTFCPPDGPPDDKSDHSGSTKFTINTRSGLKRRREADPKDRGSPEPRGKGGEGTKGSGQKRAIYPRLSEETLQVHDVILGTEPTKSLRTTTEIVGKWLIDCGKVRKEKGGWKVMRFFRRKECC